MRKGLKTQIIGRASEIKRMDKVMASRRSEFVAFYGRRRVGKTYLIREYFNDVFDFELTGVANANTRQQLKNFKNAFNRRTNGEKLNKTPQSWIDAFQNLMDFLESIPENRKKVIFFDELPWLDTARSDFIPALEHFWNSWATRRKDIVLVTCGSAASWMINTLINHKGGLHNRVTERIKILPFNLHDTELMLKSRNHSLDRYQILHIYMVTGGIPFYLEALESGKSAWQNVDQLCFDREGMLVGEFQNLFASLFRNSGRHESIVLTLSQKKNGMTRKELAKKAGFNTGGGLTRLLTELEESGFISTYVPFNKKLRDKLYRLSDFYCLFYLKFMRDNTIFNEGFWGKTIDAPAQRAWAGYTFEQVCLDHALQIKQGLGIWGSVSKACSWRSSSSENGAQIDMVIDRSDRAVNICEIKFSINPFTINKPYDLVLRNKVETFREETKTRKALFLTMITTFGLVENEYAHSLVHSHLTMDVLFEKPIPA